MCKCFPATISNINIVPSFEDEAIQSPSGLNFTDVISFVCPVYVDTHSLFLTSHTFTVVSLLPMQQNH